MKIILILGLFWQAFVSAQPLAETDIENKQFDAKKPPMATEPEIDRKDANTQWQALSTESPAAKCANADVWKAEGPAQITVIAYKNKTAAVQGVFDRVWVEISTAKKSGAVQDAVAKIDLTSYNSGSPLRDWRVQRYILNAEKTPLATATLHFPKAAAVPKKGMEEVKLETDLQMGGEQYHVNLLVHLERTSKKEIHLATVSDVNFAYATEGMKDRILKLVSLCNHQFLSTSVKLGVKLNLTNACGK